MKTGKSCRVRGAGRGELHDSKNENAPNPKEGRRCPKLATIARVVQAATAGCVKALPVPAMQVIDLKGERSLE
jgi:hypothetical protein